MIIIIAIFPIIITVTIDVIFMFLKGIQGFRQRKNQKYEQEKGQ